MFLAVLSWQPVSYLTEDLFIPLIGGRAGRRGPEVGSLVGKLTVFPDARTSMISMRAPRAMTVLPTGGRRVCITEVKHEATGDICDWRERGGTGRLATLCSFSS